ncbi:MAG: hypothetical protein IKO42_07415 [Opitutales bacterium]|nr:hypothetical protein [Opitutales bacterium]
MGLANIDYIVILIYAAALIGIGVLLAKKASGGLDEYFLGGRTLPWYLLGTSGMANWFDLTGTMVITSFLFMIGPRALFIEFRGGVVLILVFILCFTAKWHRRSGCMTGAEWMQFRFGKGKDADAARLLTAIVSILPVIGMIAYLIRGTGQFLSMFLPFPPSVCAIGFALVAVAYTASAGFYGVVVADLLQSALIIGGAIVLSIMAYNMFAPIEVDGAVLSAADSLKKVAQDVTGNTSWTEALPSWNVQMPDDPEYKFFQFLIIAMGFYMVQQAISGLASGSDQKYFAARSDKECGKLNLLVSVLISVRWPMMIGLAVLGISLVNEYFNGESKDLVNYRDVEAVAVAHDGVSKVKASPELMKKEALIKDLSAVLGAEWGIDAVVNNAPQVKKVLQNHEVQTASWLELSAGSNSYDPTLQKYFTARLGADWAEKIKSTGKMRIVSDLIKEAYKDKGLKKSNWHETTTSIINGGNPELAKKIEEILGDNWQKKLMLVGYHGVTDPERILPAVISAKVKPGWMGVLLVTLLAASMSTFGSTVNSASAYAVKDIYQKLARPNAGRRELIVASWSTTILITGIGFFLSLVFDSINDVWDWIIMSVTTGLFVPGFLRMYWWRMNGWGVAFGMASGGVAAILQRILQQNYGIEFAPWDKFAFVAAFAFTATIAGCLMTKPTPMKTLVYFYKKTRPFGFWGPVRKYLNEEQLKYIDGENRRDAAALPFAFLYQVTLFMLPMLLVIHQTKMFLCILPVFVVAVVALYLLWYKNLRPDRKMELETDNFIDADGINKQ